ncbi:hypothetical protein [Ensifer sp. Root74]|nr:hypothetical protein [Ensifer sp. Root74]
MKRNRFTDEQIIVILKEHEAPEMRTNPMAPKTIIKIIIACQLTLPR